MKTWMDITRISEFATYLDIPLAVIQTARRQRSYIYIEAKRLDGKKGKLRDLCYPPYHSELRAVQKAIKEKCLSLIPLDPAVRGYLPGNHNINSAAELAGVPFVAKLDVTDFHPSITPALVTSALLAMGLSRPLCRIITQLVTYKSQVPQGAKTSNHIANVIISFVLGQGILKFAAARNVAVVNFGDDTAFAGKDRTSVDECVEYAKSVFLRFGLKTNSKSSSAEHVGASRVFIGTSTARSQPDLLRKKYRGYRAEFRETLHRQRTSEQLLLDDSDMRSIKGKIAYTRRLNADKARRLADIFFRICAAKAELEARLGKSSTVDRGPNINLATWAEISPGSGHQEVAPWEDADDRATCA